MRGIFDSSSKRKPSHQNNSSSEYQSHSFSNGSHVSNSGHSSGRHRLTADSNGYDNDLGNENNPISGAINAVSSANSSSSGSFHSFPSPHGAHRKSSEVPTENFSSQASRVSESFSSTHIPQVPRRDNYPYNNQQYNNRQNDVIYPTTQNLQRVSPSSSSFAQVQPGLAPPLPPLSSQQASRGRGQSGYLSRDEHAAYRGTGAIPTTDRAYPSVPQKDMVSGNSIYKDASQEAMREAGASSQGFMQNTPSQDAFIQEESKRNASRQNALDRQPYQAFNGDDGENNSDFLTSASTNDDDFIFGPNSAFNTTGEKENSSETHMAQKGLAMAKYRHKKSVLWIILAVFGSLVILCLGAWMVLRFSFPTTYNVLVQQITNIGREDYTGPGYGSVDFTVNEGESLQAVADDLASQHIVASSKFFIRKAIEMKASSRVQPGTFHLKYHMKSADVLSILINPAKASGIVSVLSNSRVSNVIESIKASSSWSLESIKAAFGKENASILPPEAHGSFEGWLGLGTYSPKKYSSPSELAKYMVSVRIKHLNEWNVPQGEQRERILTIASIIGGEVNNPADYGKVSRVIENRLAKNMPLGMDSVVAYGNGVLPSQITKSMLVNPTNPYSSRIRKGLPPTPINQPNRAMINAAMNPTPGDWLYFVTVNLHTGETKFTDNYQQFEQYKKQYEEWQANNPNM